MMPVNYYCFFFIRAFSLKVQQKISCICSVPYGVAITLLIDIRYQWFSRAQIRSIYIYSPRWVFAELYYSFVRSFCCWVNPFRSYVSIYTINFFGRPDCKIIKSYHVTKFIRFHLDFNDFYWHNPREIYCEIGQLQDFLDKIITTPESERNLPTGKSSFIRYFIAIYYMRMIQIH